MEEYEKNQTPSAEETSPEVLVARSAKQSEREEARAEGQVSSRASRPMRAARNVSPAARTQQQTASASAPRPRNRATEVSAPVAPEAAPRRADAPVVPAQEKAAESAPAAKQKLRKEPSLKKGKKRDERPVEIRDRGGIIVSVLKALIYIAFVLVISGFLAIYGIRMVNDVFAFVKDEMTAEITVESGATLEEVADLLYSEGIIENADWFTLYTGFKYRDRELEFVSGTYTVNSTMNYNTLIAQLTPKSGRVIRSILIPEGYTVDQIIDLLVSEGIGTREGYVNAIQNYDYNYEFLDVLDSIELKSGRKYRLEGYLFPAKYDFYQDSGEIAVIDKMLAAFQANFTQEYYDRLTELDMNMDEIITLASIIEREAQYSSDMYYISGVFHNRLNNSAAFPYLGSDATVQYALPEHKAELTKEDLAVDSPYNTHKYPGLTPGAICNPGMDAITAALYPEDKLMETRGVKSYYFVAGIDGYSLFASNEREHQNNIAKVEADKKAAAA